jgi:CubicO group peptidase (beta-lactamase class C family)
MKTHALARLLFRVLACVALVFAPSAWAEDAPSTGAKVIFPVLQPFVERHELAGAVTLVADKDRVLSLEAVGFADVAARKPMPTDALFWIASQSKSITATALMMLVDEGKVKLDDPVEKYFPEFKNQWQTIGQDSDYQLLRKPKRSITVRYLLTHTSGMPFKSALEEPTLDLLPLRLAVRSYAVTPLQSEPGSKFSYSNAGINSAGCIIEAVSGMPYEEFLDKKLFEPLGMKDTTFWPNEEQLKRLARAYSPNADKTDLQEITISQLKYPLNDRKRQPMPAGGLFSTASDIGRFCRMVLNGGTLDGKRYLSEDAVKQMSSRQTEKGVKENWGLGWSLGDGSFGHGGALSTNMTIDTKRGLVTVFLVQHGGFPGKGDQAQGTFHKAAEERFGNAKR